MKIKKLTWQTLKSFDRIKNYSELIQTTIKNCPYYSQLAKDYELECYKPQNIYDTIENGKDIYLSALIGKKDIGFIHGHIDFGTFWLNWIGTKKEYRNTGIASNLFYELLKQLKGKNIHKIWFDTRTENKEAIRFFKRLGCKKICKIENHWYKSDFYLWQIFI